MKRGKRFWLLIMVLVALGLSSCAIYEKHIYITADDEAQIEIGDIEVLADVKDGDETLSNQPNISPEVSGSILPE